MHPFDWQLLQSTYILRDRWLALRADTCQLPNGRTIAPYYVLEYPPWVNTVVALQTIVSMVFSTCPSVEGESSCRALQSMQHLTIAWSRRLPASAALPLPGAA